MAKAKKLPSGSWRVQAYRNGIRKSFTAETKKQAELLALEWLNDKLKEKNKKSVGDCINEYIEMKSNVLSPATISGYKQTHKNYLSKLDHVCIDDLDQITIQKFVNELALTKSAKTVKNAHSLLNSVMKIYVPDVRLHTTLPTVQKKIKNLPPVADVVSAVRNTDVELPVLMAVWLGMRMSEIRGAKKSDITDGILTIHETIVTVERRDIKKDATKTFDSTRIIALPKYILKLIEGLQPHQEYLTNLSGNAIYKQFSRLLDKHDIQHISFHDLRHLNASTMLALGVPDKYAMERGGWSTTNVMKSVYQHTLTAERVKVDAVIDEYFENIVDDCTQNCTHDAKNNEK